MSTTTLTESQEAALRAVAEHGAGVRIDRGTARALERRGLATIDGTPVYLPRTGASLALTDAGTVEALRLWREHAETLKADAGRRYAAQVIAKLEARVAT